MKKEKNYKFYGLTISQFYRYGIDLILAVYEKYDRKCSLCDETHYLAIHHIDRKGSNYIKKGLKPNNSLENLQLLCRKCHGTIHAKQRWDKQLKKQGGYLQKGRKKEYMEEYREKHKSQIKEYYQKNKEKIKKRRMERYWRIKK